MATPELTTNLPGAPETATAANSVGSAGRFAPGNVYRFPKGKSGNPKGRPPRPLADALERDLGSRLPNTAEAEILRKRLHLPKTATWAMAISAAMVRRAILDTRTAAEIADRTEGRATLPIELSTPEKLEIRFKIEYVKGDDQKP